MRYVLAYIMAMFVSNFAVFGSVGDSSVMRLFGDSNHANVYGVTLDRNVLKGNSRSRLVKVWILASDPENDPLVFNFMVSSGKILDAEIVSSRPDLTFALRESLLQEGGYEVIWDLSEVEPGEHKITVGVDDGCGLCGMTQTQTVKVDPMSDKPPSRCPTKFTTVSTWVFTKYNGLVLRLLAVPNEDQDYETLPPVRWTIPSNRFASRNGSPLVDIDTNRKQQVVTGSFVRDPNFTSPSCDFSAEFRAELPKLNRR